MCILTVLACSLFFYLWDFKNTYYKIWASFVYTSSFEIIFETLVEVSVNCLLFMFDFNLNWNGPTNFGKTFQYNIS
jgi:hypothetical protein